MKNKFFRVSIIFSMLIICSGINAEENGSMLYAKTDVPLHENYSGDYNYSWVPLMYKTYSGKEKIKLPPPDHKGISLEEAIKKRRSTRNFSNNAVSLKELSILLFAADGITRQEENFIHRSAPSAGAVYPIEIYLIVNNVEKLKRGLYHYSFSDHSLEFIREGNLKKEIVEASLRQLVPGEANVTFILSSIWQRITEKYGERGYRYTYIEAGHVGQNIYLEAASLGLGCVAVGAFSDDKLNKLLGIDGKNESSIYMLSVGKI